MSRKLISVKAAFVIAVLTVLLIGVSVFAAVQTVNYHKALDMVHQHSAIK